MAPITSSSRAKKKGNGNNNPKTSTSTPRSAVQVRRSLCQEMQERQERALDLENQLQQCATAAAGDGKSRSSKEATANRLRIPLCEVLADMMLTDPARSIELDVDNRLWRHCFYSRIVPQRTKIAKAKKRSNSTSNADLVTLEQSLHTFLAEAVTLYQYMAQNLLDKLQGKSGHSQDEYYTSQQSQDSSSTAFSPLPPLASTKGIVELLHRIYIRLGDLFRYTSTQLTKAQDSYTTAASLGPGHGHAYNQIAVVCQVNVSQQQSAVALYWYARSLWAATEKFETSRSNLTRLFQDNAEWLQQQQQTSASQQTDISSQQLTQLGNNKPVLQTRQFLAEFVDLHKYFFLRHDSTTLYRFMGQVMDKFSALLQLSAFGDALLVKLVCVQAFSEWNCRHALDSTAVSSRTNLTLFSLAARTATYQFASRMADKVLAVSLKQSTSKQSIRLWLPLLLVSEYIASTNTTTDQQQGSAQQRHGEARQAFWERMVQVWNHVQAQQEIQEMNGGDDENPELLKDYKPLVGFAPFEAFLPVPNNNGTSGFVSDDEAIMLLTHSKSPSNVAAASQDTSSKGQAHAAALARRMIRVAAHIAESDPSIFRIDNGSWTFDATSAPEQLSSSPDNEDEHEDEDEPMLPPDNGGGDDIPNDPWMAPLPQQMTSNEDVLMYQTSPRGGPALLVPGALLGGTTATVSTGPPVEMDHILGLGSPTTAKPAFVAPPPGIGPPPGFGGFSVTPADPQPTLFSGGGNSYMAQPFLGDVQPATVHDVLSANGHSVLLNPPTQNPFATMNRNLAPSQQLHSQQQPNPLAFLDFHDTNHDEGHQTRTMSLLDSGLLPSLWMDDSKSNKNNMQTHNPFAF